MRPVPSKINLEFPVFCSCSNETARVRNHKSRVHPPTTRLVGSGRRLARATPVGSPFPSKAQVHDKAAVRSQRLRTAALKRRECCRCTCTGCPTCSRSCSRHSPTPFCSWLEERSVQTVCRAQRCQRASDLLKESELPGSCGTNGSRNAGSSSLQPCVIITGRPPCMHCTLLRLRTCVETFFHPLRIHNNRQAHYLENSTEIQRCAREPHAAVADLKSD